MAILFIETDIDENINKLKTRGQERAEVIVLLRSCRTAVIEYTVCALAKYSCG